MQLREEQEWGCGVGKAKRAGSSRMGPAEWEGVSVHSLTSSALPSLPAPTASQLKDEHWHPEIKNVSFNPSHRLLSDGYSGIRTSTGHRSLPVLAPTPPSPLRDPGIFKAATTKWEGKKRLNFKSLEVCNSQTKATASRGARGKKRPMDLENYAAFFVIPLNEGYCQQQGWFPKGGGRKCLRAQQGRCFSQEIWRTESQITPFKWYFSDVR